MEVAEQKTLWSDEGDFNQLCIENPDHETRASLR